MIRYVLTAEIMALVRSWELYLVIRPRLTRGCAKPNSKFASRPDDRCCLGDGGKSGLHGIMVPDNVRRR